MTRADVPAPGGVQAFRGTLLHFPREAAHGAYEAAAEYVDDGMLLVRDGRIEGCGAAADIAPTLGPGVRIVDLRGRWLVPGFIDTHVHSAQLDVIASSGEQLLNWLERYTFPAERRFADPGHAQEASEFFLRELLRNGTTTAVVFPTVHKASVEALFEAARRRRMRLVAGKILMDRNCPDFLRDTPADGDHDSRDLIERWHEHDRLHYAVTPRFAPTSSHEQMTLAGRLLDDYPRLYVQSHVAENRDEVRWAAQLFPWARSYLDVYDHYGLLRPRAVYAHCIHLDPADRDRFAASGAAMAFCPTSNLFLGSGLFDRDASRRAGAHVTFGSDVAGGTSFSLLRTMHEGYKVLQLAGQTMSAAEALYYATRGAARALLLDDRIGSFSPGCEADFVVLDPASTPLLARRWALAASWVERLFALMILGDDRAVAQTYILGERAHDRDASAPDGGP
ncbi:MAG TPA: guanine deaminase [Burkholderiaceae bacterium]|nr:guanine deaminase [Burkholderiaceae bacterium]